MLPMLTTIGISRSFEHVAEMVIEIVAGGDGAAGRVDAQHHRLHVVVLADAVDLLLDEAVGVEDRRLRP